MLQRYMNWFKSDCRYIVHHPKLLSAALYPLLTILLLRFAINPVSDLMFSETGFSLEYYYTIIAISLISVIPVVFGLIYAFIFLNNSELSSLNVDPAISSGNKSFPGKRMIVPALLSIITVLITVLITDPAPSEGWLRSLFAALLFSVQAPLIVLLTVSAAKNKKKKILLTSLYGLVLVAVPLGLLLHHPWNYFLFFSPLYWATWAWIIPSAAESLVYGTISLILSVAVIVFFRYFLRKPVQ